MLKGAASKRFVPKGAALNPKPKTLNNKPWTLTQGAGVQLKIERRCLSRARPNLSFQAQGGHRGDHAVKPNCKLSTPAPPPPPLSLHSGQVATTQICSSSAVLPSARVFLVVCLNRWILVSSSGHEQTLLILW